MPELIMFFQLAYLDLHIAKLGAYSVPQDGPNNALAPRLQILKKNEDQKSNIQALNVIVKT